MLRNARRVSHKELETACGNFTNIGILNEIFEILLKYTVRHNQYFLIYNEGFALSRNPWDSVPPVWAGLNLILPEIRDPGWNLLAVGTVSIRASTRWERI